MVIRSKICGVFFNLSRLKFVWMAQKFSFIHPSLYAACSSATTRHPHLSEKQKFAHNSLHCPQNNVYYPVSVFIFFAETLWCELLLFFPPSTPWTSRRRAQRPGRMVEKFWCASPLKGPSYVILFLGRPCEFAKPRKRKKTSSFKHAAWSKGSILCFWRSC